MKIISYCSQSGTDLIEKYISRLAKEDRIFYVTVDADSIYLLHACRKQKNKTEKKDSKIVISRAKELSKEVGKNFI